MPSLKDRLTPERRSANMRAIRAFGSGPEQVVETWIRRLRLGYEKHDHRLPGRPDFVFPRRRKIIMVHGDFWHGWQFPRWKDRLSKAYWKPKIERNRRYDRRNRRRLRRAGWRVLVIWEHQIRANPDATFSKVRSFLETDPEFMSLEVVSNAPRDSLRQKGRYSVPYLPILARF